MLSQGRSLPENEAKTKESRAKKWRDWVLTISFGHLGPVIPDLRLGEIINSLSWLDQLGLDFCYKRGLINIWSERSCLLKVQRIEHLECK